MTVGGPSLKYVVSPHTLTYNIFPCVWFGLTLILSIMTQKRIKPTASVSSKGPTECLTWKQICKSWRPKGKVADLYCSSVKACPSPPQLRPLKTRSKGITTVKRFALLKTSKVSKELAMGKAPVTWVAARLFPVTPVMALIRAKSLFKLLSEKAGSKCDVGFATSTGWFQWLKNHCLRRGGARL